jgi:hypothetical protein
MISHWLSTGGSIHPELMLGLLFVLAPLAGSMVRNFPEKFLDDVATPTGQFVIFLSLNIVKYYYEGSKNSYFKIIIESILDTAVFQGLQFVVNKIYQK